MLERGAILMANQSAAKPIMLVGFFCNTLKRIKLMRHKKRKGKKQSGAMKFLANFQSYSTLILNGQINIHK